ncbi:MAG TPA: transposase [Casimicrobiaceae bacterium]|nr:transposase [Casimicrobiaceae bacterium]
MPRRPRFSVTDLPIHVVQRGNDRKPCFFEERDFRVYLKTLGEVSLRYGVRVHAYALMTNHVHLLVTPGAPNAVSTLMQALGTRYVKYVNATRQRTGTLWEGRFKACLVGRDEHVLAACRYIDLNPVRAGIVEHPGDYPWSSYAALAGTRPGSLVHRHVVLEQLGCPPGPAYARWCGAGIHENELQRIREATNRELAFGSDEFRADIEARTARATFARPRGRPPGRH